MKHILAITLFITLAVPAIVSTQANPSLAGSWSLSPEPDGRGGRGGRGGGIPGVPVATELIIKVSPADVTVDSNTGSAQSMQTAIYKLDGTETTVPGPLGWTVKATAAATGPTLIVTTIRSLEGPNGPIGAEVKDVYEVAGNVLTIERTQGRNKQKLLYNRKS